MDNVRLKELGDAVRQRAVDDVSFRAALWADPRATIEREFNVSLPEEINSQTLLQRFSRFRAHLEGGSELGEEELENVAGGNCNSCLSGPDCGNPACH